MAQITNRQTDILKAICQEFIETAEPVGSASVEKKYNLGVSPATIRAEMAQLTNLGYLKKPHPSAGRMPTSMGLKYFVKNLMSPRKLSVAEEVGVKEKVWDYRRDFSRLLQEAAKELSRRTQAMALVAITNGPIYSAGVSNLLDYHEFFDIDVAKTTLSLLDEKDYWQRIAGAVFSSDLEEPFHLLLGEELEREFLEPCGFIYQSYETDGYKGVIGVLGPARLPYADIIPLVDYLAELISDLGKNG